MVFIYKKNWGHLKHKKRLKALILLEKRILSPKTGAVFRLTVKKTFLFCYKNIFSVYNVAQCKKAEKARTG